MNDETIKACARALVGQIIEIRRHLHAHPELSFQEHETADYLADRLTEAGIPFQRIAGTGLLARITGTGDPKRCVVLRADTDALPIQENSGVPFTSVHAGVMHACGHDIHTSCLLGALLVLQQHRELIEGTVFGLFQPGEELAPGGAASVLEEDPFHDYTVVAFVGEHVAPEILSGHLGFRSGQYMASSDELYIKVLGTGGHGALPHTLTDPVVASAALITALQQITSRNGNATIPTVLSIGRVIADGATNIIPPVVEIAGTLRTMDETWRELAKKRIRQIADGISAAYGVRTELHIPPGYPCVINDAKLAARGRAIAARLWGEENIEELALRMTAEDFGTYTKHYPGLFFRLGTARHTGDRGGGLHSATFNPDEEAINYGIVTMAVFALEFLKDVK